MKIRKIALLAGSRSDLPKLREGINLLRIADEQGLIEWKMANVCSAHRNRKELRVLVEEYSKKGISAVIVCAGKLAAIFGDVDSFLRNELGNNTTRVITVPLKGKNERASLAALHSALEVPNSQFIFQEEFFHNPTSAFEYALSGILPAIRLEKQKPSEKLTPAEAYDFVRIKYPKKASYDPTIRKLEAHGFFHIYTGKTRETFINPKFHDLLYVLATDRISIFDIVLNALVPMKGSILTAMTIYWLTKIFNDIPNHIVAYGDEIIPLLPRRLLREVPAKELKRLAKNMIIVKKCQVLKVEAIVRGFITGSALESYEQLGMVCGIPLPEGLVDGIEFPEPIFTPSTKAEYGLHDENISFDKAVQIVDLSNALFIKDKSLYLYKVARDLARRAGITIADTKFEFGLDPKGKLLLVDEVLTPDSSRFWPEDGRLEAIKAGKTPPSLDKQSVRDAGKAAGIKEGKKWIPPKELIQRTSDKYQEAFLRLVGKTLNEFHVEDMGIK